MASEKTPPRGTSTSEMWSSWLCSGEKTRPRGTSTSEMWGTWLVKKPRREVHQRQKCGVHGFAPVKKTIQELVSIAKDV